nr:SIS domain-containing protein [Auraticoccus cholistanensis]
MGRPTTAEALQQRVVERELATLQRGLGDLVADGSVLRAAQQVVAARRRVVAGAGKSYALAHLLSTDLGVGLSQVQLVDAASGRGLDVLTDVRTTDVLVAVSLRRYRPETASLARLFAERGGTVVALTDAADSPVAQVAATVITVPTTSASHVDSATAVVSVAHLLTTLSTASAKGARRRLAEREALSDQLALYTRETP